MLGGIEDEANQLSKQYRQDGDGVDADDCCLETVYSVCQFARTERPVQISRCKVEASEQPSFTVHGLWFYVSVTV